MVINTKLEVNSIEISDSKNISLNLSQNEHNSTSTFSITFDNNSGRNSDSFSVNDTVDIYADQDAAPTTKIFTGFIEDINFKGRGQIERLTITGRDSGGILQDVIVSPRIFTDSETSVIVDALITQNVPSITTNNVNVTTTDIEKITFTNVSVYDALKQLADTAGFFFYVDTDNDFHFEERESVSSGETIDESTTYKANFKTTDQDQYNKVTLQGNRQLTASQETFTKGTDNTGSVYTMEAKPRNVGVTLSGATNTTLSPGGVLNIGDPSTQNIKFLVDFQSRKVVLTSGTSAGDNIQATGSVVIVDYQRSTPIISVKQIASSYPKHKVLTDLNIKSLEEASQKATTFLNEHKDPATNGTVEINGFLSVVPGQTVIVNIPNQNQDNQTYSISNVNYDFSKSTTLDERVQTLQLNKKIFDFVDVMKDQMLRLRALEASQTDASITSIELGDSQVEVDTSTKAISRSIGSTFYFHVPGHDIFESPSSLLGDMRTGSITFVDGVAV